MRVCHIGWHIHKLLLPYITWHALWMGKNWDTSPLLLSTDTHVVSHTERAQTKEKIECTWIQCEGRPKFFAPSSSLVSVHSIFTLVSFLSSLHTITAVSCYPYFVTRCPNARYTYTVHTQRASDIKKHCIFIIVSCTQLTFPIRKPPPIFGWLKFSSRITVHVAHHP